jgi:F-type H+-transporting ATPase subunit delta
VLDAYRQRLMEHLKVVRAEVTTAVPLPPDLVEAVRGALERVTSRQVLVAPHVDPAILGGVVTRIGSTVYDGSVKGQLERLRERLTEGA